MEVQALTAGGFFRVFTACPGDAKTYVLDVRERKKFARGHAPGAYCVRVATSDPGALLDYSKAHYEAPWSQQCWWGKRVVVYGDPGLSRQHPVVAMLAREKRAASLAVFKEGLEGLSKNYPFLVTTSLRGAPPRWPSEILPQVLYLSDWEMAEQRERLQELKISRVITVHNNPENMRLPEAWEHLRITLADVETQDISPHFAPAFDFIEAGKLKQRATLVHCGAGISRSAALCIAYLMRRLSWTADQALAHCKARRSLVDPNAGFWRRLCALEAPLGLAQRSDPGRASFPGADAPATVAPGAAGEEVTAHFVPLRALTQPAATAAAAAATKGDVPSGAAQGEPGAEAGKEQGEEPAAKPKAEEGGARESRESGGRRGWDRGSSREGRGAARAEEDEDGRKRRRRERSRSRSREGRGGGREKEREREGRRGRRSRSRGRGEGGRRGRSRSRSGSGDRERRERGHDRRAEGRRGDERGSREEGDASRREEAAEAGNVAGRSAGGEEKGPGQAAGDGPPPRGGGVLKGGEVVLRVVKEGKTVGLLELGMRGAHACAVVGRDPSCALHLEHLSISRRHAHLTTDSVGSLHLTDLNSAHRTWADGVWLRPETPRRLLKGSTFRFGASSREYEVLKTPKDPPLPAGFVPA